MHIHNNVDYFVYLFIRDEHSLTHSSNIECSINSLVLNKTQNRTIHPEFSKISYKDSFGNREREREALISAAGQHIWLLILIKCGLNM